MTIQEAINVLQLTLPPLLGVITWYLNGLNASVKGIEEQLKLMNGRLIKLEEWRYTHDELDSDREKRASSERAELRQDLHRAQDSVQRQISDLKMQHNRFLDGQR